MTILASMSKWKICIEQLNAQARVEADSPRVARGEIGRLCARRRNPFGRGLADELRFQLCRRRPFEALAATKHRNSPKRLMQHSMDEPNVCGALTNPVRSDASPLELCRRIRIAPEARRRVER